MKIAEDIIKMFNEYKYDKQVTILKYIVEEEFDFKLMEKHNDKDYNIEEQYLCGYCAERYLTVAEVKYHSKFCVKNPINKDCIMVEV